MKVEASPPDHAPIAGWPTEIAVFRIGGKEIRLVTVRSLESQLDRQRLLREESFEPPYWALVWSGSKLLARWVASEPFRQGVTVLDVGCGLGLVGLTAAQGGARVTMVDRDPCALEFVRASASLAGVEVESRLGDVRRAVAGRTFDAVMAAELLYERETFAELAGTLVEALAPAGILYIADSFRVDTREFYLELSAFGLECRQETTSLVDEEGTQVKVRLAAYARRRSR